MITVREQYHNGKLVMVNSKCLSPAQKKAQPVRPCGLRDWQIHDRFLARQGGAK